MEEKKVTKEQIKEFLKRDWEERCAKIVQSIMEEEDQNTIYKEEENRYGMKSQS